jgi:gliding motility-associated-like protein
MGIFRYIHQDRFLPKRIVYLITTQHRKVMRKLLLVLLTGLISFSASADHITGGEMFYSYSGFSNGLHNYTVTLKLFMRCNSGRQFPDPAIVSIFDKGNFSRVQNVSVAISQRETIAITNPDPCISNPPQVCYEVAYYSFSVSLPASAAGYTMACEVNYRIRGINNLSAGSQVGATYTSEIPGTSPITSGATNNSAAFTGSDLVVVCAGNYFSYSFAAQDVDGDLLNYSFAPAYNSSTGGANGSPAGAPPYNSVPYSFPDFGDGIPLGGQVSINSSTGLITGVAPAGGVYVVTVSVDEIRNGVVIATQRKDLQINIADCSVAAAQLDPDYMLCGTTRTLNVSNQANSPLIISYDWEVFSPGGASLFTSNSTSLSYTFATNGTYFIRLIVNKGQACTDTANALVYVYPGLVPDFRSMGICINKPTFFTDQTTLLSGTVNSWKWDFGEPAIFTDVSVLQNDSYTYPGMGSKNVRLIVTTTEGCRDTVEKIISIIDKPPITLAFRDTLICINDRVQLQAAGTGNFSWSPAVNIINANTATPTVFPATSTTYYADLETDGCTNRDSVKVRVVNFVTLQAMNDTTICSGDTIQLRITSDGLQYNWTPANQLLNASVKNPVAVTPVTTTYNVTAIIGGCSTTDNVLVTTVPYPLADAGKDTTICFNTAAQLNARTDGRTWTWSPATSLLNTATLNPVAYPAKTTNYLFTVYDTDGCPKPGIDTILVTVLPKINAFAGRDTAVVIGQALQLTATGGETYLWSPAFALTATEIANPVATFTVPANNIRYKVLVYNSIGCADSAFVNVKVFATGPTVFVPTAFTPNNDGKNDVLRPIAVGMQQIQYFQVFNRWGQLVFSTSVNGAGWDGQIGGQSQASNTYVWMVKAVDFSGKSYFQKGTVTLIR